MASPMTAIGLAALKAREGVRLTAYKDSVGVWTIGYGSTKGVKAGDKITQARAEELLMEDIADHDIMAFVKVPTTDNEADALRSIAFNIGLAGAKGSTFLRRLNAGESRLRVAEAIMLWRKPPEIISRREAERDQFLTPYATALPKARSTDQVRIAAPPPAAKLSARVAELRASAAHVREYHRQIVGDPSYVVKTADEIDEIASRLEAGEPETVLAAEAEEKRTLDDIKDAVERITEALVDLRLAAERLST